MTNLCEDCLCTCSSLPITAFRQQSSQLLEVLFVDVVETRRLGAVDIDDGDGLQSTKYRCEHIIHPTQSVWVDDKRTSPPQRIGTTISLRLSASQAICPGNANTSGTTTVSFLSAAVPHTPRPNRISWQAGFPWNGPSSSLYSSGDDALVERDDADGDGNRSSRT